MATHTTYYNLTKPSVNDKVNIGDLNDNADIIDTALHNKVNSDDLTANNVMMSDGVTSVEDVVEANTLGTAVDVSSYTSSNKYICPSNGYLALYSSASNGYIIAKINDMNISAFYSGTRYNAIYVKKGMQIWIGERNGAGYSKFYPLT